MSKTLILIFIALWIFQPGSSQKISDPWIISAPAGVEFTKIDKNGVTIIPNGRKLTPAGTSIVVAPHPYGLTLSPDGNTVITANSGINPLSITIIRDILSEILRCSKFRQARQPMKVYWHRFSWGWPFRMITVWCMLQVDR